MNGAVPYNEVNSTTTTNEHNSCTTEENQNDPQSKPNIGMRDMIYSTAFDQRRKSIENYKKYKNIKYQYNFEDSMQKNE